MTSKVLSLLWVVGVCAVSGWLITSAPRGAMINADILALLPHADRDPVIRAATERVNRRFERRIAMLVGAPHFETAMKAAERVYDRLSGSGHFARLSLRHSGDPVGRMISFYAPLRFRLLGDAERTRLLARDMPGFEKLVLRRYYAPQSAISSTLVENDPFLLLPAFLAQGAAQATGRAQLREGYLTVTSGGKSYILITGDLAGSAFAISLQRELMPLLDGLRSDLPRTFPGATFLMAGVLPHAAAGTASALSETSTVGTGSLLGVILLLTVIFRSARPLALTLISIALGCVGGFAACIAVFGEVHLMTLVFGASLVGISVDYALHYFCERYRFAADWSPASALRHVLPGITLGLITSIIGFAGLFFAPFPGMQGMALFSSVGLVVAYGCVVIGYPPFTTRFPRPAFERPLNWMSAYGALWQRTPGRRAWLMVGLLAAVVIAGCLRLEARDDIRLLQTPDAAVTAEQERLQSLLGQSLASQYFLVEGRDQAAFLARQENLAAKLRRLRSQGRLAGYLAISDFIASPQRQEENRALLAPLIGGKWSLLGRIANRVGLPDAARDAYAEAFRRSKDVPPVTFSQWLSDPVSQPFRSLWLGPTARGVIGITGLRGVGDLGALREIADADPKVTFVDPAGDISELFRKYRRQTTWLTIMSYGAVMLILLLRYGIRGGLLVMAPPLIAAAVSLSVLGLLGEPLNLFNIMALLLVLGIGVDYALFYRETGADHPATLLAIALSSLTTLLAFGLLTLSRTAAIHSFGLTILVGIFAAFVLSPMAGWIAGGARR